MRSYRWCLTLLLFAPLLLAGAPARAITVGGAFALTAPDGTTVTDQTYRGKWLLVYFGYTSCPDSCPTALADIAAALRNLGAEALKLQPLFITVDPEHDTPAVMGHYAASFDQRIVGLTGTTAAIDGVARAYGAYAAAGHGTNRFDHSVYIYLMDPQGGFVRAFDPDWSGERIATAIRQAMTRDHQAAMAATGVHDEAMP
jgi:protein SCO1/2